MDTAVQSPPPAPDPSREEPHPTREESRPDRCGSFDDPSTTLRVTTRDFLIFQAKLLLDGAKDFVLLNLSIVAYLLDVASGRSRRRRLFYRVMEWGERVDLWLNLHGAADDATRTGDGLFGASRAGSPTLLGSVEQWMRGGDEPRTLRESVRRWVHTYGER